MDSFGQYLADIFFGVGVTFISVSVYFFGVIVAQLMGDFIRELKRKK